MFIRKQEGIVGTILRQLKNCTIGQNPIEHGKVVANIPVQAAKIVPNSLLIEIAVKGGFVHGLMVEFTAICRFAQMALNIPQRFRKRMPKHFGNGVHHHPPDGFELQAILNFNQAALRLLRGYQDEI